MGYVLYVIYSLATVWLMAATAVQLHLLWHARRQKKSGTKFSLDELPFVTVQVPVYNEKFVIGDLLRCLAELDYPKSLFEVQVLDDSTDETTAIIEAEAKALEENGINVAVIRRTNRKEYKAGALQHGLSFAKGDFIAIFDADFRPRPDFLKALLPPFTDASVGLVQARWAHQNRNENFLTRVQTYLLDLHFGVEQQGRAAAGYFTNFCGTAGVWRKQCIVDAGGWDGTVLSEDLDLSYRAQLKGWKAVYEQSVDVPAQLPAQMEAFKVQQFRWNKGTAQTARKSLALVLGTKAPLFKKLHAAFHLLGSFTFVCLFVSAVLSVPLLYLRQSSPLFLRLTNYTVFGTLNLLAIVFLYFKSAAPPWRNLSSFLKNYSLFALVYLALSVQNTVAVLQGLAGLQSPFVRTPKFAEAVTPAAAYKIATNRKLFFLELAMLIYFLYGAGLSLYTGDLFFLGIQLLFCCGLAVVLYPQLSSLCGCRTPGADELNGMAPAG